MTRSSASPDQAPLGALANTPRRSFLLTGIALAACALHSGRAHPASTVGPDAGKGTTDDAMRLAPGPHTLDGFPAWLAADANLVKGPGLKPRDLAGPLDSLLRGDCEFAHAGVEALARAVLEGHDPVLVLSPADPHRAGALFSLNELRSPRELASARVGVAGENGASATSARLVLQNFGIAATLIALGSPAAAFASLAERKIDAAYLPMELGFRGRREFNWNMFEGGALGVPGGLVTTRRYAARNPQNVSAVVAGVVEAIHRFKTRPDSVSLALQRYLQAGNLAIAGDLQALYAPIFRSTPSPSVFFALAGLRQGLATRHAAASRLHAADLVDASFVDALGRNGFIERLYGQAASTT